MAPGPVAGQAPPRGRHRATRQMVKIKALGVNVQWWLQSERQVAIMGDKIVKTIHEKSIINGVNGEKSPLSLLKKKLTFKDDKIIKQCVLKF